MREHLPAQRARREAPRRPPAQQADPLTAHQRLLRRSTSVGRFLLTVHGVEPERARPLSQIESTLGISKTGASARQSMPGRARSLACLNLRFGRLIACIARKLVVFNRASGDTGSYHFRGVTKMGINWSFVCFARDFCPLNNFGEVLPSSVSHGFH